MVSGIKKMLAVIKPSLPDASNIKPIADQSVFVRASIEGVIREGVIAAALTSLMILLFLGSMAFDADRRDLDPRRSSGRCSLFAMIGGTSQASMTLGGLGAAPSDIRR